MNELAGAALPSQKFGANAAWLRLNVILYNLLSAYKRVGLPEEFHTARPKRLRFLLLNTVGKVVRHARETLLRCTREIARALAGPPRTRFALKRPALGHRPSAPMRGCRRLLAQRLLHYPGNHFRRQRRLASRTGGIALQPGDPLHKVALLPPPNRR